ncbi:MAG: hypothetical protein A2284_16985 [Deltaproteobacteria bacterium RIFOXYA12_FULL_61_11]|nr:MAG: hypothetical protein A2284_16985 [Deltaproteobacteria bacterium RIFOXYA12_FULL_61_11]
MGSILVVDSSKTWFAFFERALAPDGCTVSSSGNYKLLLLELATQPVEALFLGLELARLDDFRSLVELRKVDEYAHLPLVLFAENQPPLEELTSLFQRFNTGFLRVGSGEEGTALSLLQVLRVNQRLHSETHLLRGELERLAMLDAETTLYNGRYFQQRLSTELSKARRHGECFALVLVQVQDLEVLVQSFGLAARSRVLRDLAGLLTSCIRKSDVACALAPDRYALLLLSTKPEGAAVVGEKIRQRLQERTYTFMGRRLHLGCTLGSVLFDPSVVDPAAMLALATTELEKNLPLRHTH